MVNIIYLSDKPFALMEVPSAFLKRRSKIVSFGRQFNINIDSHMHFNLAMKCDRTKGSLTHIENPSVEEFGGKFPDIGLKETSLQVINQEG